MTRCVHSPAGFAVNFSPLGDCWIDHLSDEDSTRVPVRLCKFDVSFLPDVDQIARRLVWAYIRVRVQVETTKGDLFTW